jgi:hypothetical protein
MKNTQAILAAVVLTVLPIAAYSQRTPAPADAFLYIIWPPDGATLKGAGIGSLRSRGSSASISKWWWPLLGGLLPAWVTPMLRRPNRHQNRQQPRLLAYFS